MIAHPVLQLDKRNNFGKVAASKLRASSYVPGVIYDKKNRNKSISIQVNIKDIKNILLDYMSMTRIIDIEFDGSVKSVVIKDISFHPVTDEPSHVDFMEVKEGELVDVKLPVRAINKEESVGVKRGGEIVILSYSVPAMILISKNPSEVLVDVAGSVIGQRFKLSDAILPSGIKIKKDLLIAKVAGRKVASETDSNEDTDKSEKKDESTSK